jgi:signal transduction histidine kinase
MQRIQPECGHSVMTIKRSIAAVTVAVMVVLIQPSLAGATEYPEVAVHAGSRVHREYPRILGMYPVSDRVPYENAHDCATEPHQLDCDVIAMRIDPQAVGHVLVRASVSWTSTSDLDAYLFDSQGETLDYTPPSDVPILLATIPSEPVVYLVVANSKGVNDGYRVDIDAQTLDLPTPPHATFGPSTDRYEIIPGTVPSPFDVATPAVLPSGIAFQTLQPAALTRGASQSSNRDHLPFVVVLLAALLLVGSGTGISRVARPVRWRPWRVRIFWKLLVPFLVTILAVGATGAYLTVRYLAGRAEASLDRDILERSVTADSYLRDQELAMLESVRFAANVEGTPQALAAHDARAAERSLGSAVAVRRSLAVLAALDANGAELVSLTRQPDGSFAPHAGTDWQGVPAVTDVLHGVVDAAGDKHAGYVRTDGGRALFLVAGPVRIGEQVVGAVVAALDADDVAHGAARRARATIALYDGGGARMAASAAAGFPSRVTPPTRSLRIRGHGHVLLEAPLVARGARVGTLAVRVAERGAFASVRGATFRLAALLVLAIAAIVAIGLALTRSIVTQVRAMVTTNRALGAGDLAARAPVVSGDELGELAQGFNQMAEQLEASYGELERRVAERTEELSRLYRELVTMSNTRSEFFATVSHELRTPLFAIIANAELGADPELRPDDPEELGAYFATIDQAARLLLERVNEILELARAESEGVELHREHVPMGDVIEELRPTVAALARKSGLDLVIDVAPDLPLLDADASRLRQIVLNLVSNAVKYTAPGGEVRVSLRAAGAFVELAVADTGAGIPAEIGDRIFEPYFQVEGIKAVGGQPSSGLGLAVTKRLVEAHGGTIGYTSAVDQGSTFVVRLPAVSIESGAIEYSGSES